MACRIRALTHKHTHSNETYHNNVQFVCIVTVLIVHEEIEEGEEDREEREKFENHSNYRNFVVAKNGYVR